MMADDNIDNSVTTHAPSVVQIESNKLVPIIIVLAVLCGLAVGLSFIGFYAIRDRVVDAETQTQLLEHYVTGLDSTLIAMGIKNPGDDFEKYRQEHLKRAQQ